MSSACTRWRRPLRGAPTGPARAAASQWLAASLLTLLPAAAGAHDTWLEWQPGAQRGRIDLALTTGTLFPASETGIAAASLVEHACRTASGRPVPLVAGPQTPSSLRLQARARAPTRDPVATCSVQTEAFEVEVPARLVPTYLREIAAPAPVQAAWAEQQRQGIAWQERYTKHARISLPRREAAAAAAGENGLTAARDASRASAPRPTMPSTLPTPTTPTAPTASMALDIEIDAVATLRAGQTLHYRVLRDGQPLAGQAVELRGELSRFGLWRRTDSEGRANVPLPWAGRWVLRATDLRLLPERPGHWTSRFVTHAFTVAPQWPAAMLPPPAAAAAQPQPNNPSMPNARSANHQSATATMSAEPPISTARR